MRKLISRVTLEDVYRELRTVIGAISTLKDTLESTVKRLSIAEDRLGELTRTVEILNRRVSEVDRSIINIRSLFEKVGNDIEVIRRQSTLLNENIKSTLQSLKSLRKEISEELGGMRYELKDKITRLFELESQALSDISRIHGMLSNSSIVMASMELDLKKREEIVKNEISNIRLVLLDLVTGIEELKNLLKSNE
ncbi:MAG: hypothetical protein DRJ49_02595 [Thermoprotei archaeon]|nr:MAG: hypothetical protein DRJ49_02595 [Thermoprotei archaeon]